MKVRCVSFFLSTIILLNNYDPYIIPMNDSVIAIRKEMITLSLIKDELDNKNYEDVSHIVNEKLKRLMNIHTNLSVNQPELLVPTTIEVATPTVN